MACIGPSQRPRAPTAGRTERHETSASISASKTAALHRAQRPLA